MRADFEKKLATIHRYDDHEIWKQAHASAKAAVDEAMETIKGTFAKLGIPREFAPGLDLYWYGRGENASKQRRAELTKVAASRIEAITKRAKHNIEATSVDFQTRLLAGSLESDDARKFLESMPTPAALIPLLTPAQVREIAGVTEGANDEEVLEAVEKHMQGAA